jgi:hypothetical protein
MRFVSARVTQEPSLAESIGYADSIPAARVFATTPGLDDSVFATEFRTQVGDDAANLSRPGLIRWIRDFFDMYVETVIGEAGGLVDVLSLDLHVPKVTESVGTLSIVDENAESESFEVTILGSGGGGNQRVAFSMSEALVASACTRQTYNALCVWELVEVIGGPDIGRRFARLRDVASQVAVVRTNDIPGRHCDQVAQGPGPSRRLFDYRRGSVTEATASLEIETSGTWKTQAGLSLAKLGVDAKVATEVDRRRTISIECRIPGGRQYEAYLTSSGPFWNWAREPAAQGQ